MFVTKYLQWLVDNNASNMINVKMKCLAEIYRYHGNSMMSFMVNLKEKL